MRLLIFVAGILIILIGDVAYGQDNQDVLFCTDNATPGPARKDGSDMSAPFRENRFVVRKFSATKRTVTNSQTNQTDTLICQSLSLSEHPNLLSCIDRTSTTNWLFNGDQYTRSYMHGKNIGGNKMISQARGICTKFPPLPRL